MGRTLVIPIFSTANRSLDGRQVEERARPPASTRSTRTMYDFLPRKIPFLLPSALSSPPSVAPPSRPLLRSPVEERQRFHRGIRAFLKRVH